MSTSSSPNMQETVGSIAGLLRQARLGWRLWNDGRVPPWVKLIPVAGLLYLLSPIDLIPDLMLPGLGEVDDVVVLLLALKMFVNLSPSGVVREHLENLFGKKSQSKESGAPRSGETIEATYRVLDQHKD